MGLQRLHLAFQLAMCMYVFFVRAAWILSTLLVVDHAYNGSVFCKERHVYGYGSSSLLLFSMSRVSAFIMMHFFSMSWVWYVGFVNSVLLSCYLCSLLRVLCVGSAISVLFPRICNDYYVFVRHGFFACSSLGVGFAMILCFAGHRVFCPFFIGRWVCNDIVLC
jgi:hypothetical protein